MSDKNWCEKIMQFIYDIKTDRKNFLFKLGVKNVKQQIKKEFKQMETLGGQIPLGKKLSDFLLQVNINLVDIYGIDNLKKAGIPIIKKELWDKMELGYPDFENATKLEYTMSNCKKMKKYLINNDLGEIKWPKKPNYDSNKLKPFERKTRRGGKRRKRKTKKRKKKRKKKRRNKTRRYKKR